MGINEKASPIRIGVAGLGFGAQVHVPALRGIPGVELMAIAGTDRSRTEEVARKISISRGCEDIQELLSLDLDAVTLALPPEQNERAVSLALEMRVPVLSEKPLTRSGNTTDRLVRMAHGQTVAVNFQFAELNSFKSLKNIIDTGALGRVRHAAIVWMVESWAQQNQIWSWKTDAERGGGVISILGSHLLFLIEMFFGTASHVLARLDNRATSRFAPERAMPAEDMSHMILEYADGLSVAATISNASPGSFKHLWEIVFDHGTITLINPGPDYMSGFSLTVRNRRDKNKTLVSDPPTKEDGRILPFRLLAERFLDSVRHKRPAYPDFAAAARVQHLMDALRESAATGHARPVPLAVCDRPG